MTWYSDDDGTAYAGWVISIPRAERNAVVGARHRCATWSAQQGTDGAIPAEIADGICSTSEIGWLLAAGKWVQVGDDYQMTDWQPGNRLHEQVLADRETARGRMRRNRASSPERSAEHAPERSPSGSPERAAFVPVKAGSSSLEAKEALTRTNGERSGERSPEQAKGEPYSPLPYHVRHVPEKHGPPASPEVVAAALAEMRANAIKRAREQADR